MLTHLTLIWQTLANVERRYRSISYVEQLLHAPFCLRDTISCQFVFTTSSITLFDYNHIDYEFLVGNTVRKQSRYTRISSSVCCTPLSLKYADQGPYSFKHLQKVEIQWWSSGGETSVRLMLLLFFYLARLRRITVFWPFDRRQT